MNFIPRKSRTDCEGCMHESTRVTTQLSASHPKGESCYMFKNVLQCESKRLDPILSPTGRVSSDPNIQVLSTPEEVLQTILVNLLWLEAKQVTRGLPSEMFPELTLQDALVIRGMGLEALKDGFKKKEEEK